MLKGHCILIMSEGITRKYALASKMHITFEGWVALQNTISATFVFNKFALNKSLPLQLYLDDMIHV